MTWQAAPHPDDPPRPPIADEPVLRRPIWTPVAVTVRPRADTGSGSALAVLPLLVGVLSAMSVLFAGGWSLSTVGFVAGFVALMQFVVARRDRRTLGQRGFVGLPPASLALVSPILYLGVRARACSGHDPEARVPVRWAIGATAVTAVCLAVTTWFFAAIGEGLAAVSAG